MREMIFYKYGLAGLLCLLLTSCAGGDAGSFGQLIAPPTVVGKLTAAQLDSITAQNNLEPLPGTARCDVP
jgi:hypothetical protein